MPKVSVLTPIYNTKPEHLRECIESVLNQTFTDFEFLILNDSPDNQEIEKIVKEYAKHDKRIKYSKNTKNIGITKSRNKLLKMARGEYLAVFDHDDISMPDRLEKEVKYLDENPDVGIVSGWIELFGDKKLIRKMPENDKQIKIFLTDNNWMSHTASMIRRSVLINNNIEYEEFFSPAEDYRLCACLMDVTKFHNIQKVLVKYRMFDKNTSVVQKTDMIEKHNIIQQFISNKYPMLRKEFDNNYNQGTRLRLRLFGFIPMLKIKNNTVYLFEFLPIFKIKWR
ncbi:MAG: glycosyltransferase family 2 protein [Alphaproteobacteria bacterium]|nr:glycosyltransferase family 2 protein [Alphaproteobacteria bacterium]